MRNNILKSLTENLGFKILALFFAFILWLFVYNLEDPTKSKTLTINVEIANRETLDNMGKYFDILDGSNKASFSVTAARSILDKLDETDFVAVADMNQLILNEDGTMGTIPIDISCVANINENSYKLSTTSRSLKISLEDLMVKQFVVSVNPTGNLPEGFALGSIDVTAPNVLKVSGPKSIVETITAAVANVNVSVDDVSGNKNTYKVTPILYDKNGKEVDTTRLTLSNNTVTVSAEILNTKEVALAVKPSGTPAEGYMVTSISSNPTTILLKGDKSTLNNINSIEIPERVISIAGKDKDVKTTIDVSEYIPEGVTLADPGNSTVEITVEIGKLKEKVFSIDTENIIVTGLATNYKLEFAVSSVAVQVSGLEKDIANLNADTLSSSLDVTNLAIGNHEVELKLDLDESKFTYLPVKVTVYITEVTAEEEIN